VERVESGVQAILELLGGASRGGSQN
jgi:hypothetical protein